MDETTENLPDVLDENVDPRLIRLYEMRSDVTRHWTLEDQARELGISVSMVKKLARSPQYMKLVRQLRPIPSPMIDAGAEFLTTELLRTSLHEAKRILEDPRASATAKTQLISAIWRYCFEVVPKEVGDPHVAEAMEFLKDAGVKLQQVNIVLNGDLAAPEFRDALRNLIPADMLPVAQGEHDLHAEPPVDVDAQVLEDAQGD